LALKDTINKEHLLSQLTINIPGFRLTVAHETIIWKRSVKLFIVVKEPFLAVWSLVLAISCLEL
jgi:hypothetical protein